jgi:hypothetical protein
LIVVWPGHAAISRGVLEPDSRASAAAAAPVTSSTTSKAPYAEALFRTAKYRPVFPAAGFADLAEARQWAAAFVHWYNHEHRHSGIRYVTPAQRHAGGDCPVLAARHALYQQAREANPRRWSGPTRNWTPIGAVTLNPERDSVVASIAQPMLSSSTGGPALPSRPGVRAAASTAAASPAVGRAPARLPPVPRPGESARAMTQSPGDGMISLLLGPLAKMP